MILSASVLLLLAATGIATADKGKAARHRERGVELYQSGRYRLAADQFMAAYENDPQLDTLFAWAQSERKAGDCTMALRLYRHYLDKKPSPVDARAARVGIDRCERVASRSIEKSRKASGAVASQSAAARVSRSDAGSPAPTEAGFMVSPPAPAESISAPASEENAADEANLAGSAGGRGEITAAAVSSDRPVRWFHDWRGALMVGGGTVIFTAGLGVYLSGSSQLDGLEDATHDVRTKAESTARRRRVTGAITGLVGVAAITLGVLRYRRLYKSSRKDSLAIQPYASSDSAGVVIGGRF